MSPAVQQVLSFLLGAAAIHGVYLSALLLASGRKAPERLALGLSTLVISVYLLNYRRANTKLHRLVRNK